MEPARKKPRTIKKEDFHGHIKNFTNTKLTSFNKYHINIFFLGVLGFWGFGVLVFACS